MMIVFAKPCTNCLRVALGLIFIITIIQRWTVKNVVHCVKVSPARHKKKTQKKNKNIPATLHRATPPTAFHACASRLGPGPVFRSLGPPRDDFFSGHQRRDEAATSGSRSSDLSGSTTAFPPYRSMLTRSRCLCFWFWFFLFCWNLHRHCKGCHRTPSLPPVAASLFGFLHSTHFFRHIYNFCYSWCLSVLHSCNYIYFWCSSTWQTCLMCTIFS